jgi:hypothetical protein
MTIMMEIHYGVVEQEAAFLFERLLAAVRMDGSSMNT